MDDLTNKLNQASDKINESAPKAAMAREENQAESIVAKFGKFCVANNMVMTLGGKQYLKAEAWQYLASLIGLFPSCECLTLFKAVKNKDTGETEQVFVGVKTIVTLIRSRDLAEVSKATMTARCDEPFLKDKDDFAVYGMSQTRAISRAVRNVYGWVAVAAGYEATPYDEMPKGK